MAVPCPQAQTSKSFKPTPQRRGERSLIKRHFENMSGWEEAFELISLKLCAHPASANGRTPSWLYWIAGIQTFGLVSLSSGGFSCCFNTPYVICYF